MIPTADLTNKARFMRNASPHAYDEFCKAFEKYTDVVTTSLVMANIDLQLHQGYVRQCHNIIKALEEAKNERRDSGSQASLQGAVRSG